jgi:hypothetical protein
MVRQFGIDLRRDHMDVYSLLSHVSPHFSSTPL